jgi:predicted nucleic acid-binding protein
VRDVVNKAVILRDVPPAVSLQRDPKDECYLNLALAASAHYLLSRDKDLLDLMKDETTAGQAFRQQFPQLQILDPVAFLRQVALGPPSEETSKGE